MPWSCLRAAAKERMAPSVRDRIAIHQARYRRTREEVGRVWITVDGREVASFDTNRYIAKRAQLEHDIRSGIGPFGLSATSNRAEYQTADAAAKALLRSTGEYDDYSALADLEAYQSLAIEDALASLSPLVRALAIIDQRVGKRRLRAFDPRSEHPLVQELYHVRCAAGGIKLGAQAI